ncbi:MAG: protein phosphatase 2C domain-containing protein [Firmicutes bacterium]|nr:protein phosphatase 2C domain-containing protein [Bacillota bacterium]
MIIKKWIQAGAVVLGKEHKERNKPCQDRIAYVKKGGVHAISLADGAGSKPRSEAGAEEAVLAICELMATEFDSYYMRAESGLKTDAEYQKDMADLKKEIVSRVQTAIAKKVAKGESITELPCTLLFVAVKGEKLFLGHIGDGVIGALMSEGAQGSLRVLSAPENGGAPNITFFITGADAEKHLRLITGEFKELKGIILMSDGPEEVLYSAQQGLHENAKKLFSNFKGVKSADYCDALSKFLSKQISKFSYDDLSLNILYLTDVDTASASEEYTNYLFEDVNEMITLSSYSYFLDNASKS